MLARLLGAVAVVAVATGCAGVSEEDQTATGTSGVGGEEQVVEDGGDSGGDGADTAEGDGGDMDVGAVEGEDVDEETLAEDDLATEEEPAPGTEMDFVANVGDRVFFGFDRSTLTEQGRETLDAQAEWLQEFPEVTVTIEGHTDERGTREYNLALGERRAHAVKDYLVASGIAPDRIETVSYGEERPAVEGSHEAAWAQNRRAVTVVEQVGVGS